MVGATVLSWARLETHAVACEGRIKWLVGFAFDVAFKLCMIHGYRLEDMTVGTGSDEWEAYGLGGGCTR